ncbi:hypothetical protein [Kitasatospora sp. NPDC094011]|uniref:hypothetical protein n=1 Tax=Kitasatospora sp. NPDC094011 TaxID=3364090 RepID=UPI00381691C7
MYGGLPPAGTLGAGGASVLSLKGLTRPGSGFQALATVVAASTLVMAAASLGRLLPPRRQLVSAWSSSGVPRSLRPSLVRAPSPSPSPARSGWAAGWSGHEFGRRSAGSSEVAQDGTSVLREALKAGPAIAG